MSNDSALAPLGKSKSPIDRTRIGPGKDIPGGA
jgi:hypothetical protein